MTKLEFLAVLYSLDKMHVKGNHDDAHDVIKKLIRQAEGINEYSKPNSPFYIPKIA